MRRLLPLLALFAAVPAPAPAREQRLDAAGFEALRAIDLRLGTIAHRLATANVALCRDRQPATGVLLHAIDQYDLADRLTVRQVFGFSAPVAIEAVVPGSPAAAALAADQGVEAIDDRAMPASREGAVTGATRDAALKLLATLPADEPTRWRLAGGRTVVVAGRPGCRATFEVLLGKRPSMLDVMLRKKVSAYQTSGSVVVPVDFLERYADAEIAVILAHELAHIILRHEERLEAASVQQGALAEFGRNRRLIRQTEDEADLLGVHLLRNAGYDPASAPPFWRDHGDEVRGGFYRKRTHGSPGARARAIEAEIAAIPADAPRPYLPPVLAKRDQPLN